MNQITILFICALLVGGISCNHHRGRRFGGGGRDPIGQLDNLFEGRRELDREILREEDQIGRQVGRQIERDIERKLGPAGREVAEEAARQILRDSDRGGRGFNGRRF